MLTNLVGKIDGYKTYILSALAILVALAGHVWGPVDVGPVTIPAVTWTMFWVIVWKSSVLAALRSALSKIGVNLPS